MRKYKVVIWNETQEREALVIMEMTRARFTKKEYDMVIQEMVYWAAINCDYASLKAEVSRDGKNVMEIKCETKADGSEIHSVITVNDNAVRCMTIAW